MSHLAVSLLGPFQTTLDGEPVAFSSVKARALLAYLAVESARPHPRETLTALLWPEEPAPVAHNNFRHTLSSLRHAIGDRTRSGDRDQAENPMLLVTRETVQFNCAGDCWLDVRAFQEGIKNADSDSQLIDAVALYRGDFLEGFYVKESVAFEDWALLMRDRLQRQAVTALQRLVAHYEHAGDYDQACDYARRQVELERWQEQAHRQLMRLLALTGRRSEALAQYGTCCRLLTAELAVEPTVETRVLYEQIRDDQLRPASPPISDTLTIQEPAFFSQERPAESEKIVFVARERELAYLEHYLGQALKGQGRVAFVTGEAGQGKTSLIYTFTHQAQESYPDLVVAAGNCNAYTGVGDPYLPFREALELLTGDVQARWLAGVLTREHACHLWRCLPHTAQALVNDGPDLIDILLPGAPLLNRAMTCTPAGSWLDRLRALVENKAAQAGASPPKQEALFEQYTTVLHMVARRAPLLLIVDDLQWVDLGSASLLFHLGRRLTGHRILILGAYRSEEVASGRRNPGTGEWERHPLEPIVNEFKRDWGDIEVNLAQTEGQHFVQTLLDSEPHHLSRDFSAMLYRQTEGHPLFTVELLRGMQERGDLVRDEDGCWVEGPVLDWETLPARVEAVIAERIGRLSGPLQDILRVASVEGEVFTAEVVAQATHQKDVIPSLSGELDRRHRLVRAQGIEGTAARRLSRYRFRHILFQTYIYHSLDPVERAHLHQKVGDTLLAFCGEHTADVAPQLARHFEQAGRASEAAEYYRQAGERAVRMAANAEAIDHLNKGSALLRILPHSPERDERELALQFAIAAPIIALRSWGAPEAVAAYDRAMELCQALNKTSELLQALILRQFTQTTHAEHRAALQTAEQFYQLAQRLDDPTQTLLGHQELGVTCMSVGEFSRSLHHLQQLMACYDREMHHPLAFVLGTDPAVLSLLWRLYPLWYLGYPDQALKTSQEGMALAQELNHVFSSFFLLNFKIRLHRWRREVTEVQKLTETYLGGWFEHKIEMAQACGMLELAWVLSEQGHPDEAIPMYEEGLVAWQATGMLNHRTEFLCVLAEMYGKAGNPAHGLELIDEAIAFMQKGDERYHEAELYRMRGLLRLQQDKDNVVEAEADFHNAIAAARRMEAKMCELRAATCLSCLWQQQGKSDQARQALAEIYGWFTEGFDTLDMQEAKALLNAL